MLHVLMSISRCSIEGAREGEIVATSGRFRLGSPQPRRPHRLRADAVRQGECVQPRASLAASVLAGGGAARTQKPLPMCVATGEGLSAPSKVGVGLARARDRITLPDAR